MTKLAKMNLHKCAFGVVFIKFLSFIVRYRGIEVEPAKITAFKELPPPQIIQET